jgi:hypothetical protein
MHIRIRLFACMRIRIQLFTFMRILIRIFTPIFHFYAYPEPNFHFRCVSGSDLSLLIRIRIRPFASDADPELVHQSDVNLQITGLMTLQGSTVKSLQLHCQPSWLQDEPPELPAFHFDGEPDLDPATKNERDPDLKH